MNLRERRLKAGFTQVDMAVKVGVSLTTYIMWEKLVAKPNEENAKKLEEVLNGGK